jgi:3-oxoacyl-[acyl-carrier protein] reductase
MGRLAGKIAIITGSGRGIGRAMARRFAAEGAKIAVTSVSPEAGYVTGYSYMADGGPMMDPGR